MLRTYDHGRSIDHHMTGLVYKLHHHIHSHVAHSHRPGHNVSPTPAQPTSRAHRSVRVALETDACGSAEAGVVHALTAVKWAPRHAIRRNRSKGATFATPLLEVVAPRPGAPQVVPPLSDPGPHGTEPTCPRQESQRPVPKYGTHIYCSWIVSLSPPFVKLCAGRLRNGVAKFL